MSSSEQLSFAPPPPTETAPELSEEEQKKLDVENAAKEAREQAGKDSLVISIVASHLSLYRYMPLALPYRWRQTLIDVTVSIPLPGTITSRDLIVEIKKNRVKVQVKGQESVLEGELPKEIKVDDSTWTLGKLSTDRGDGG